MIITGNARVGTAVSIILMKIIEYTIPNVIMIQSRDYESDMDGWMDDEVRKTKATMEKHTVHIVSTCLPRNVRKTAIPELTYLRAGRNTPP
jgi:hypothetical protein